MPLSGRKILVAEDEPDQLDFIKTVLEDSGAAVVVAHNGTEALSLVRSELPHAMTLDINMPGTDVMDLLGELKGDDVVVLDLRGLSDVCDFFVLGTGQADVQVKAIAQAVVVAVAVPEVRRPVPVAVEERIDAMELEHLTNAQQPNSLFCSRAESNEPEFRALEMETALLRNDWRGEAKEADAPQPQHAQRYASDKNLPEGTRFE